MTKEELIKEQFPNDEFLQSAVLRIVDKCTAELEKENAKLKAKDKALEQYADLADAKVDEVKSKLAEAKEHIQTLISCLIDWVQEGDKDYCHIAEAEQFLKKE